MRLSTWAGCLAVMLMSTVAMAQAPGGGGDNAGGPGGNGGRGGGRDMTQFRQAMMDRLKENLGVTDDEFKVLQPKIEKVQTLQRDAMGNRFGMGRARGQFGQGGQPGQPGQPGQGAGGNPPAGGQPAAAGAAPAQQSDVQVKTRDLQDMLENKDAKPEEIKAKLDALRDAKAKAKEELTKAQAELKELLSQRQEAVLVTMGTLD